MKTELTPEDRARIRQFAQDEYGIQPFAANERVACCNGAEYENKYQREKQQTLIEMIKADRSNAIELQEQEFNEEINKGREEALTYVLECIEKLNSLKK